MVQFFVIKGGTMKEVYDKIYGLYNEILKIPMDSPKYFELYKE